jgi:hypothetical protein
MARDFETRSAPISTTAPQARVVCSLTAGGLCGGTQPNAATCHVRRRGLHRGAAGLQCARAHHRHAAADSRRGCLPAAPAGLRRRHAGRLTPALLSRLRCAPPLPLPLPPPHATIRLLSTGRPKMALERGTNPKLARRTCSPRYGLPSLDWAGVAKRPRELIHLLPDSFSGSHRARLPPRSELPHAGFVLPRPLHVPAEDDPARRAWLRQAPPALATRGGGRRSMRVLGSWLLHHHVRAAALLPPDLCLQRPRDGAPQWPPFVI